MPSKNFCEFGRPSAVIAIGTATTVLFTAAIVVRTDRTRQVSSNVAIRPAVGHRVANDVGDHETCETHSKERNCTTRRTRVRSITSARPYCKGLPPLASKHVEGNLAFGARERPQSRLSIIPYREIKLIDLTRTVLWPFPRPLYSCDTEYVFFHL